MSAVWLAEGTLAHRGRDRDELWCSAHVSSPWELRLAACAIVEERRGGEAVSIAESSKQIRMEGLIFP